MFKKILKSFPYAFQGIIYSFITQVNFRFHITAALLALLLSFVLRVSNLELLFVISAVFLVLTAELFNTAVETVVDLYTREYNFMAQTAKNIAAGAVLTAVIYSLTVAAVVFIPKILNLLRV
ncbi:MAG: diacylglycerol kinase [Firmicutes bacterium HGW-Firmicutes-13]|nr:MAG: diacylglycerol kinase [Firmicutes bacterium HGW-Firmicutes-13]